MSELSRQRRLRVDNRLAELRARYGRELEDQPLPAWLDTLEGARGLGAAGDPFAVSRRILPPRLRADRRPPDPPAGAIVRVDVD